VRGPTCWQSWLPSEDAVSRYSANELKPAISASLKDAARSADLQSYEIPRDFVIETTPFTLEKRSAHRHRKLAWPRPQGTFTASSSNSSTSIWRRSGRRTARAAAERRRPARPRDRQSGRYRAARRGRRRRAGRRTVHRSGWRLVVGVDVRQPCCMRSSGRRARRRDRQPGVRPGRHRRIRRGGAGGRQQAAAPTRRARP